MNNVLIVSPREWNRVVWRNGLGTSAEILSRPDIILNSTQIPADVGFSAYAEFDRALVLVSGELTLAGAKGSISLTPQDSHTFRGEENVTAIVHKEPVRVFNILVDRRHWRLRNCALLEQSALMKPGILKIVYVAEGSVRFNGTSELRTDDTLISKDQFEVVDQNGWALMCQIEAVSEQATASIF